MDDQLVPVTADLSADDKQLFDFGTLLGRHQAFALIANKCSAADAFTLREIKEEKLYRKLNLSWEDFCRRYAGVCDKTADRIIANLDEFGESYFNLSQILPVRADTYREIASKISDNTLEVDGRKIEINRENTLELMDAVSRLRDQLKQSQAETKKAAAATDHLGLTYRADALFAEIDSKLRGKLSDERRQALIQLIDYVWLCIVDANRILRPGTELAQPVPEEASQ